MCGHLDIDKREIPSSDLEKLRPTLARELLQSRQKKRWKSVTRLRQANLNPIWKFYQKRLSNREDYPYLPTFAIFLQLPAIQILKSSDLAAAEIGVGTAANGNTFLNDMVKQQVDKWVEEVKREMLVTLGGSDEWNDMVPARRMPHPVLRFDSRWKCKVCDDVEPKYKVDGCLDFAGVCRHECREKDGIKRKRGATTQIWSTSNFVKDEQASRVPICLEGHFF